MAHLLKTKNFCKDHLPELVSVFALLLYLAQSLVFTAIRYPNMDEGAYLYKGYQFVLGTYQPFQPYGFWMNKMYLPFYLFGLVQKLFVPGLLAPRLLAVFLGCLTLVGLWVAVRRVGNRWLAALAVLALALNPNLISIYSIGNSQVVTICVFVWVMALSLGSERPLWQVMLGAFLAGILVLCRENTVFLLPLLALYNFWQHKFKKGLAALLIMTAVFVIGNLIFWPGILYLWDRWIPSSLEAGFALSPKTSILSRFHSVSLAIRFLLLPVSSVALTVLMWKKRALWRSDADFKTAVFLTLTLAVFYVSHTWAAAGKNYCVYCTTNYYAFFAPLSFILLAGAFSSLMQHPGWPRKAILLGFLPVLGTVLGFSYFENLGYPLMQLNVPRFSNGKFLPGSVELWQLLNNKFGLNYESARVVLPVALGLLVGLAFSLLLLVLQRRKRAHAASLPVILLVAGLILTPLFSWPTQETYSSSNVPAAFQKIGAALDQVAQPGSKIYLDGALTPVVLLYSQNGEPFPPQINGEYSFREGRDSDDLLRAGFWNQELSIAWRAEAQIFVISADRLPLWRDYIHSEHLVEVPINISGAELEPTANIHIFMRR